jgi:hypothetical protein
VPSRFTIGRRWRPDLPTVGVLVSLAFALHVSVHFPPDLQPGRLEPPASVADAPPRQVQDFAYIFNYARWSSHRRGTSPYSYDAHREFLRAWLGPKVQSALCFAYGPAIVALLAPLFLFTTATAWLLWNLAGAYLAGWTVRMLAEDQPAILARARFAVIGTTALQCLVNGQTALVTTGCLAALLYAARDRARRAHVLVCGVAVALLAAKPPLAIVSVICLLLAGHTIAAGLGLIFCGLEVLAAALYWSPTILWDYAGLVGRYTLVDADPVVRAGFSPYWMTNLRSVLLRAGPFDDARAFLVTGWVFAAVTAIPLVTVTLRRRTWPLDVAASWAVLAYLLFAPHLSPTEDVLLVVPLAMLLAARRVDGLQRTALVSGCLVPQWFNGATFALLAHPESPGLIPLVPFAFKLMVGGIVARAALRTNVDGA